MQWYICVHSDKTLRQRADCPIVIFVTVINNTYKNEMGTPANSKVTLYSGKSVSIQTRDQQKRDIVVLQF